MFGSQSLPGRERLIQSSPAPREERPRDKFPAIPPPSVYPVEAGLARLKEEAKVDRENKKLNKVVHINTAPSVITEQPHRDLFQPVTSEGLKAALQYVQTNEQIQTILGVNVLLRTGEFFLAEKMLGRPLTIDERINRSLSESILPDKLSIFQFNKQSAAVVADSKPEATAVKTEPIESDATTAKLEQISKDIHRLATNLEPGQNINKPEFIVPIGPGDFGLTDPEDEEEEKAPYQALPVLISASPGDSSVMSLTKQMCSRRRTDAQL